MSDLIPTVLISADLGELGESATSSDPISDSSTQVNQQSENTSSNLRQPHSRNTTDEAGVPIAGGQIAQRKPSQTIQREKSQSGQKQQESDGGGGGKIKFKKAKKIANVGKQYVKSMHELIDRGKFEVR